MRLAQLLRRRHKVEVAAAWRGALAGKRARRALGEARRGGALATWFLRPFMSRPTAMPRPALMLVLLWPAPKQSYSDSERLVKGERPPVWRIVFMAARRPVRIL